MRDGRLLQLRSRCMSIRTLCRSGPSGTARIGSQCRVSEQRSSPPFISRCITSVSGKAARAVPRTVSKTYRHHRLGEHKCSSTMKNMVGVSQVIPGSPGRVPGRTGACCLGLCLFRTQQSASLISWQHVAPRNTLLLLEMVCLWNSKHLTF